MTRCDQCASNKNCIPPDGPLECDLVFIGEAPGYQEDKHKQVFYGKTGEELNRGYLPICNLRRPNVMITNAIKCLPDRPGGKLNMQKEKDLLLLNSCAEHH